MINVIFAAPGKTGSCPSKVMSVARLPTNDSSLEPKRPKAYPYLVLSFSKEDKIGTIQAHERCVGNHSSDWGLPREKGNGR